MHTNTDILFEEMKGTDGNLGIIILNRPSALNSLNQCMIQAMQTQLQIWAAANHIKAVVIRAVEGRAFCAGGDLRLIYERMQTNFSAALHFFYEEYQLNRLIFHYPKPYIAFLDGITMGGGAGISLHGSHRIATDKLLFAMPETGIGFFPDIGASYFLPRLLGRTGLYLGLTGIKLNADDCIASGIAHCKVEGTLMPQIIDALAQSSFRDHANKAVTQVLENFKISSSPSGLIQQQPLIDQYFSLNTVEDILRALQQSNDEIANNAAKAMIKNSPLSLKITLRALQQGSQLDFDACMRQDYRLTNRFIQGHDFLEGIRALIVEKDKKPQWEPNKLERVSMHEVEKYFSPLSKELV